MQTKKKPTRTCMACNEKKEKQELLRIVRTMEGNIELDLTGKKNGRGAYICKSEECLSKAIKNKKMARTFEIEIENSIYENVKEAIVGGDVNE